MRDYEAARGRRFDEAERAVVAAAAIDALSYMARCEHARDPAAEAPAGSVREALRAYAPRCWPASSPQAESALGRRG